MLKKLDAHYLAHADHGGMDTQLYAVKLPPEAEYEDLFQPFFWDNHKQRLNVMDRVRCRAETGAFDVELTVSRKSDNGEIIMELWPKFPAHIKSARLAEITETGDATKAVRSSIVPLSDRDGEPKARVEFLEATKWRVRGYDGAEVKSGLPNKTEADKVLDKYLKEMNLILPSEEAIAAKKAEIAAKKEEREAKDNKGKGKAA